MRVNYVILPRDFWHSEFWRSGGIYQGYLFIILFRRSDPDPPYPFDAWDQKLFCGLKVWRKAQRIGLGRKTVNEIDPSSHHFFSNVKKWPYFFPRIKKYFLFQDSNSNEDFYFEKLNFHSITKCSRAPYSATKTNSRRLVKKRKLIELEGNSTSPNRDSLKLALQSIKSQIQSQNVSPSSRLSYLSAVQTLEHFLNSNK